MRRPATVAGLLLVATAYSQVISNLPQCWQSCIHNSGDFNCNDLDIPCICRLSNGNFLTDIVTCVKSNCDYQLDSNLFITPLQVACSLAGTPISSAAIRNAEFVQTQGGYGGHATTTTTIDAGSQRVSTLTVTAAPATRTTTFVSTTTDSQGSTFYILVPVTVQQGSTVNGLQRTTTSTSSVTTTTVLAVASASSASMSSQSTAQNTGSTLSTSTSTTTVTPATTVTTTTATSATNAAANSPVASTNGSPFGTQSAGTKKEGSSWLGLMVGLVVGIAWL